MCRTPESLTRIRGIVAAIVVVALLPCEGLVATLQASTPPGQPTHRSSGSADPDQARRMVTHLGIGHHVVVKLRSGETVRGRVREIAEDHFVLDLERSGAPVGIAYGDVRQLGPILLQPARRSRGKRNGLALAVVLGGLFAMYKLQDCGNHSAC